VSGRDNSGNARATALVIDAMAYAASDQPDKASNALCEIEDSQGLGGLYAACCCFAEMVRQMHDLPNLSDGLLWAGQGEGADAVAAGRFLACYLNDDDKTAQAIFRAAAAARPERLTALVALLLKIAATAIERKADAS
jgi:hypothetical protein